MSRDKVLSMIGLAQKAGKVASGEFAVEKEGKAGNASLIIVATDASEGTRKSMRDMCVYYKIPFAEYGTKITLAEAIGKDYRASVAILDPGFSESIMSKITVSEKED